MLLFLSRIILAVLCVVGLLPAADPIRVLFVGGDWKSQLPNFHGNQPMRGYFVRQEVERAMPGAFTFTLWTSYEFLQYGDAVSLRDYDVVVVGDTMGQSVVPRLVDGVKSFVDGGGGLLYCDNHKAFSFLTVEDSFDAVLPIQVVPFRPYGPEASQAMVKAGKPFPPLIVAPQHPVVAGLDWSTVPGLRGARYGALKPGATVIATGPGKEPIWVGWDCGKGRALWLGGVFANDELSEDFAKWPSFGAFYGQTLRWLAERSTYPRITYAPATAQATLTVNTTKPGALVTARHFGIHGQELAPNGAAAAMTGADHALYQELHLDGAFARTSAFAGIKRTGDQSVDDGTDLTVFSPEKYDWSGADAVKADLQRIHAEPIFLYWCPWWGPNWPDPARYTKYFAASLAHINGTPAPAVPFLRHFEIMNEPSLNPVDTVLPRYTAFYNQAVEALRPLAPGVQFGCGGFFEWPYVEQVIDQCGKNFDWFSRHPYGHTGEAAMRLQDRYLAYARAKGYPDLKFIITEWDFWIYGEPAFDYIMARWKPLLDRADTCLGSMQYRWREYQEGGYVFGMKGEFNQRYGELPPEWPNPGKDKPITYRYDAFWIMRDCRGPQFPVHLASPELDQALSPHAYAVATTNGSAYNIVINYGYAYRDPAAKAEYTTIKLHIAVPIPATVQGRSLVVSRADARQYHSDPAQTIHGDVLELDIELPARTAISITVR